MQLQKIQLIHFKNLENININCNAGINCFIGKNGSGKTNFLDAIYYLSSTKSAFNGVDLQNIQYEKPFFSILGDILVGEKVIRIQCSLQPGQKKVLKWNQEQYEKLSDHVGRFPAVLITPYDTDLVRDSSELRRRYFDLMISQCQKEYLQDLIRYTHFLKQRNAALKQMAEAKRLNKALLEPYDAQLLKLGRNIALVRKQFSVEFENSCQQYYSKLSNDAEDIGIKYVTHVLEDNFDDRFRAQQQEDYFLQRTTLGIHRDDYKFLLGEKPLKKFGSQGQQKSFVVSLKLTHFEVLEAALKVKPLLLLDDIFDKLDDARISTLIAMVKSGSFGQIFITDARLERTKSILGEDDTIRFFDVNDGKIVPL